MNSPAAIAERPAPLPAGPAPARPLRVLVLEDRASDAELLILQLRRAGFAPEWRRVETEADFDAQLSPRLDVILADYRLPQYDAMAALRRLQQHNLDIPFIIVTGVLGDELAAQCIKQGVTDYLLKDRIERLGLAVSNAIEERRLRLERREVEEQLRQTQKMESIGQLAGGIAHDFNNVLTVINGRAFLLLEHEALSDEARDSLKEICTAGARATSLTQQLLFFSRKRPIQRVSLDLNATIEVVAKLLDRLIGEHIDLVLEPARDLPPVEADASMMEQVLINLAVNARDAMPRGGMLVISTKMVELGEAAVRGRPAARPGRFAQLCVHDTGCGIAPEIMPRIFEPFFTTKETGKGTGLGLATVFGIVGQHRGWIDVESKAGAGTTFTIHLPAVARHDTDAAAQVDADASVHGGRETILVVEDEIGVREFAAAVLQIHGYRVLQARSGQDALEVWRWHAPRIDLVLTDMVMPDDLTGPELAAKLQAEKPSLEVIFTSGYSADLMPPVFAANPLVRFIHKPYTPRLLAKKVRDALDGRRPANAPVSAHEQPLAQ